MTCMELLHGWELLGAGFSSRFALFRFLAQFCNKKKCIKKLIEGVSCKNIDIDRYCIF